MVFFAATSAHAAWHLYKRDPSRWAYRFAGWLCVFATVYLPYFIWRYEYYGYLHPNTFYAKVGPGLDRYSRGVDYLRDYASTYGRFVFLPILLLIFRRRLEAWVGYLLLLVSSYLAYVAYVGGDGLGNARFLVHISPALYLLVQEGFIELHERLSRVGSRVPEEIPALTFSTLAVVSLWFTIREAMRPVLRPASFRYLEPNSEVYFPGLGTDLHFRHDYWVDRLTVGAKWLNANAPPGSLVASTAAGAIAVLHEIAGSRHAWTERYAYRTFDGGLSRRPRKRVDGSQQLAGPRKG